MTGEIGGGGDGGGASRRPGSKIWRLDALNGRRTGVCYMGTWPKHTVVKKWSARRFDRPVYFI